MSVLSLLRRSGAVASGACDVTCRAGMPRALARWLIVLVAWAGMAVATPAAETQTLEIVSKSGVHVFTVEMATTEAEREQGLMNRQQLAQGHGMLFDFGRDQDVAMWMKNTYIPLDMIFITADGRIRRIAANTTPLSTRIIPSGGPVKAVLEVPGGTAARLGIVPGDTVAHPIFRRSH